MAGLSALAGAVPVPRRRPTTAVDKASRHRRLAWYNIYSFTSKGAFRWFSKREDPGLNGLIRLLSRFVPKFGRPESVWSSRRRNQPRRGESSRGKDPCPGQHTYGTSMDALW